MDSYHSIIYLTAGEFFDSFKSGDFKEYGNSKFDTSFFTECDLLIIDDLGTENSSSYNLSNLFYIINERLLRKFIFLYVCLIIILLWRIIYYAT